VHAAPGLFDEWLAPARERVRHALATALEESSPEELSRLFKVRGALLDRALVATRELVRGAAPTLPAWRRYSGVVWSHLDPGTLTHAQRRRILVPSGLYGLTSANDPIADYRLTMKVSLGDLGNVASFWRPPVADALESMANARFVDLLPKEHQAAIGQRAALASRTITVAFLRHGGEGVAGHDAKAVKGIVARRILDDGLDVIGDFHWRGWRGRIRDGRFEVRDTSQHWPAR
jgi:hypothetical protein